MAKNKIVQENKRYTETDVDEKNKAWVVMLPVVNGERRRPSTEDKRESSNTKHDIIATMWRHFIRKKDLMC